MEVNTQNQKVLESDQLKWLESNPEDDVFMNGLFRLYVTFEHLKNWGVGHDSEKECTVFAYRNIRGQWVNAKRVKYNEDLKRDRNVNPYYLSRGEGYSTCLYGEHQLTGENRDKIVILVEAEKSAIVGSYIYPEYVWLACGGSNGLTKEKARVLKGRKILIMMDADEPGRKSAEKCKAVIESGGGSAVIIDLFPELQDGRDIADLIIDNLRHFRDAYETSEISEKIKAQVVEMKSQRCASHLYLAYEAMFQGETEDFNILKVKEKLEQAISRGFQDNRVEDQKTAETEIEVFKQILNFEELLKLGPAVKEYLWDLYLPKHGLVGLVGTPDSGKSILLLNMAINIALRLTYFLGFKLNLTHGRSIYVETEDDQEEFADRSRKILKGLKAKIKNPDDLRLFTPMISDHRSKVQFFEKLRAELKRIPVDLVVISSFGDIFMGYDSNSNTQMRETTSELANIAREFKTLVFVIHHINKAAYDKAPDQRDVQGGSGFVQKIRFVAHLQKFVGESRLFSISKGNYLAQDQKDKVLELELDPDTLIYHNTGNTYSKSELAGEQKGRKTKTVDWNEVFVDNNKLSRQEIVAICSEKYELSDSAIDSRLKKSVNANLLTKEKDGIYCIVNDTTE